MRYLKYFALLGILVAVAAVHAPAQVAVGVGFGPGYVAGPPVCTYGYYDYYPYACAPYGFYGPSYFVGGVFIGAGPWYHGYYGPGYYGRSYYGGGDYGRGYYGGRGLGPEPELGAGPRVGPPRRRGAGVCGGAWGWKDPPGWPRAGGGLAGGGVHWP